jgi:ABC-2 type transport system permease protein
MSQTRIPAGGAPSVVGLVAGRELRTRLRSKAFRIGTVVMVLGLAGLMALLYVIGKPSTSKLGVVRADASLSAPLSAVAGQVGQRVTVTQVPDAATGERMVQDGKLDALVSATPGSVSVVVKEKLDDKLRPVLDVLAQDRALDARISAIGGDPAAVRAATAQARAQVRSLHPPHVYQSQRLVLGVVVGVLLYLGLVIYGQAVAQGVVEEKTSRVVELLLATVRPWQLMAGKVIGIGAVALIQLVTVGATGLVAGLATHRLSLPPGSAIGILAWSLLWYVLGFFCFALLFAALGALVSRQEDVPSVTTPLTMVLVIPYVLGISILPANPASPLVSTLSLVPLCSPTLMPMRIAVGSAAPWQNALALALTVLLLAALVGTTGRVYRNAVLRTGARVRLSEALRAA